MKPASAQNYTERKEFRNANAHWFIRGMTQRMFDMRNNPPAAITLPNSFYWVGESGSGISDTATGDLLFYSNGHTVYNRNHQVMPNGGNLLPPGGWYDMASSYHQLCIIPIIDTPNKFHVFSVMPFEQPVGLYYWVVDMALDNGLGDVDTGRRDIQLSKDPLLESITAVPGNNCDVWVLAHRRNDSVILAYHITAAGLDTVPVVSTPGSVSFHKRSRAFEFGSVTVSPKQDKIAVATYDNYVDNRPGAVVWAGSMIAKFDPETGKTSDAIELDSMFITTGLIFSPDGNILYAAGELMDTSMTATSGKRYLIQYDVSKKTRGEILASKKIISELKFADNSRNTTFRRLGDTIILTDFSYIPSPNQLGSLCGYTNTSNYFAPEESIFYAISWGNDAVYPIYNHISHTKDTLLCDGETLQLAATPGYRSYRWNDGSTDPLITITQTGTYWVEYETSCNTGVDTYHVQLFVLPAPDITVDERNLSTQEEYDSYQWILDGELIPGATSRVHTATVNGDYQVIVSRGSCTATSAPYKVTNASNITERTNGQKIRIHPNPASSVIYVESASPVHVSVIGLEGKVYKKEYNVNRIDIRNLADGLYLIQVKSADGRLLKTDRFTKTSAQ